MQTNCTPRRRHRRARPLLAAIGAAALSGACSDDTATGVTAGIPATDAPQRVQAVTSGGFAAAFALLGPIYAEATGVEIVTEHGSSMGGAPESIPVRLAEGETPDLLIFNAEAFDMLADAGHLRTDSRVDLAHAVIGMAVRSGAPRPDIGTLDAFVETLRAAESIGYSASVSGTYLSTEVFPSLGIWDEIEPKSQRIMTERVASVVARGDVEIGFQAMSEILSIEGADLVGPIPDEIQQRSIFIAVIPVHAGNADGARRLIAFLSSDAVAPIIASTGLQPAASL